MARAHSRVLNGALFRVLGTFQGPNAILVSLSSTSSVPLTDAEGKPNRRVSVSTHYSRRTDVAK